MSKSKLALSDLNTIYIRGVAVIVFTLHKVKHCPFFGGHPVVHSDTSVKGWSIRFQAMVEVVIGIVSSMY